jgi:uncharacterized protein with NRDE domain
MCTIVALFQVREDFPLVIATNRDEFYARASSGPVRLLDEPPTVGGRDLRARGTWMGVTRAGCFVGVTNQRGLRVPDAGKRSRGELVMDALRLGEPEAIRVRLAGVDGREYNGFNLMFGDARRLYAGYGRDDRREIEVVAISPGIHVLPNDRLDADSFWKVGRAKQWLEPAARAAWPELRDTLRRMLADGELPELASLPEPPPGAPFDKALLQRLAALCVHTPAYGTRSSTVVALSDGRVEEYGYADGPPDRTEFVDVTGLYAQA